MRIAYICADRGVPVFGHKGSSIHVQELVRALTGQGAHIDLFATRFGGDPPPDLADVPLHPLPEVPRGDCASREQFALAANSGLQTTLMQAGPFDLIYERYSLWSFAGMEYAHATGIPGLLEVNSPLIVEEAKHRGLIDHIGAERMAERVFGTATALIAVSGEVAAYLERYPNTQERIHIVPNGVNPDRFPLGLKPASPAPQGMFTIGFVGKVRPWHGLPVLVEAFAIFHQREPHSRLLIVGEVPDLAGLMVDLSTHDLLEVVHLTGAVAASQVPELLASMDVAVAPYPNEPDFYFSPMKVYEYMAAGLPVVASRVGQLARLIEDGLNGLLCQPGNPIALAIALDRLRCDPELCVRLGQAARATVLQHHTWEKIAGRILHIAGLEAASYSRQMEGTD